jgi:dTDP-4-dehydrorhamnose 3,5-epimerase
MYYVEDDKAQRLCDVFDTFQGQVNVAYVNNIDIITAWHMHKEQSDRMICLKGSFKIGLVENEKQPWDVKWVYLSDRCAGEPLLISPGVYHGYKALEPGSIMLYHMDKKYNPFDVYVKEVGSFGESWSVK